MPTGRRSRGGGRTLGLVLSGGGARGAFQVGVYEQLLREPRFRRGPTVLSGTSAGAINASFIAAGKSPREMMRFWNGIADDPPVVASPLFFESLLTSTVRLAASELLRLTSPRRALLPFLRRLRHYWPPRPGTPFALLTDYLLATRFELVSKLLEGVREPFLADTARLRERLVEEFGGEIVPCNDGRCVAINTVDAHTGHVVRYVTRETPLTRPPDYLVVDHITVDMVLASASIPLLFPTVAIDRRWLWDGGLLVNTPLAPVVALGADEIVTVLVTEPPDAERGPFPHFGRAVERTVDAILENAYNVDRKLLLDRNQLAHLKGSPYREVRLYDAVRPARDGSFNAGSYLYFERGMLRQMRMAGRRAATAWLAAGPRIDRVEPVVSDDAAA